MVGMVCSFTLEGARQVRDVGETCDYSIRMAISKDVTNILLYLRVRRLGLDETPVVLNPAYIHRAEHHRLIVISAIVLCPCHSYRYVTARNSRLASPWR